MTNSRFILGLALLSMAATSCKDDYFDQQAYRAMVHKAFPAETVDPAQTWVTVASAKARLTILGDYDEQLQVRIFQQNPLRDHRGTMLMEATARSGETIGGAFSYPIGLTDVWVVITDSKGYSYAQNVAIVDDAVTATIGRDRLAGSRADRGPLRSRDVAQIPTVDAPETAQYLEGAVEVSDANENHNANNSTEGHWEERWDWNVYLQTGEWPQRVWVDGVTDPNYVLKMKITGRWERKIGVLPSEDPYARTLYVSGTWALPADGGEQRVGGGAVVVVAPGGQIIVPKGAQLNFVRHSRLIVLPGGSVTGKGKLAFPNGSTYYDYNSTPEQRQADGLLRYNYNGGTIDIDTLNNNGGYVFNYNVLKANVLQGGAGGSRYVNWSRMTIDHSDMGSGSAGTRILNGCWFECTNKLWVHNIELGPTSYLKAGSLLISDGQDGIGDGSYITLAVNALLNVTGDVSLNNTTITGPTGSDYAFVQFGKMAYVNYTGGYNDNSDITAGYVANNVYLSVDDPSDPDDNVTYNQYNHSPYVKISHDLLNGKGVNGRNQTIGNGNAMLIDKGCANVSIEGSECTPGYNKTGQNVPEQKIEPVRFTLRYCFEDNFPQEGDYDFNDVVVTLTPTITGTTVTLTASLDAVGGQKSSAVALRVKGLAPGDVMECTQTSDFDENFPSTQPKYIGTNATLLPENMKAADAQGDVVIRLLNNTHWAMARAATRQGLTTSEYLPTGALRNWYYNTVEPHNAYEMKVNGVTPPEVTYTFRLASAEAANKFCEENLDLFIVEEYNGGKWEVHTVPYKFDEVLSAYAGKKLRQTYGEDNMPWAICMPGNDFRYPIEWEDITKAYSFFRGWAADRTTYTNWYASPTKGKVY